ncbi:MAG: WD40/YVTN/BNR-like repeat-containing protein, partial [Panacagrimonas sp.]
MAASVVLSIGVVSEVSAGKTLLTTLISGIPHAAFFGIDLEGGEGVAVGAGGAIAESKDGGKTWKAVAESPTDRALLSVAKKGAHSIAVGQSGVVAIVQDGKWQTVDAGTKARLLSVDVNSSGLAIVGGQFGNVLKSTDGGKTWAPSAPDWSLLALEDHFGTGEPTIYSANVSESGQITIAGEFGVIMRSDDGGVTWRVVRGIDP